MPSSGPGSSLVNHPLEYEKTVVFVRHGMTTWNEQKRIQVRWPFYITTFEQSDQSVPFRVSFLRQRIYFLERQIALLFI